MIQRPDESKKQQRQCVRMFKRERLENNIKPQTNWKMTTKKSDEVQRKGEQEETIVKTQKKEGWSGTPDIKLRTHQEI